MPVVVELSDTELATVRKQISEYTGWFIGIGDRQDRPQGLTWIKSALALLCYRESIQGA
jgi:hypothetical protein